MPAAINKAFLHQLVDELADDEPALLIGAHWPLSAQVAQYYASLVQTEGEAEIAKQALTLAQRMFEWRARTRAVGDK